jgi:cytidine deaminase
MKLKESNKYISLARSLMPPLDEQDARTFHVTFITRRGKIQKIGVNSMKTHPKNLRYNYFGKYGEDIREFVGVHSEMSAILKYGKEECYDCTFINVRIDRNGKVCMSMPCRGCQSILKQVGYKNIWYTDAYGNFVKMQESDFLPEEFCKKR